MRVYVRRRVFPLINGWKVFLLLNLRILIINNNMILNIFYMIWAVFFFSLPGFAQDKKPESITLETNIVQVILNDEHRAGVDLGGIVSDFHSDFLRNVDDPLWNDKKYRLSFGTISQDDYTVLLDALDMAGPMSQSPQPPVALALNKPTLLHFDKQNIQIELLFSHNKSGKLLLSLTPRLALAATEIFDGEKISASVFLQAKTEQVIDNGMTIVIGVLIKEEEITRTRKFPLLGDIPIVGLVFRSRGRLMQKTETVVFLTVRTNAVDAPEDAGST